LSFDDQSFDVVLFYEAVYYLHEPEKFFSEARRVLRPGGVLIVVTVNREWGGFNPSPYSVRYLSAKELAREMREAGFEPAIKLAFANNPDSPRRKILSMLRKLAVMFHLIPKTMRGKELLKRLFYGKLTPVPRELTENIAPLERLHDPPLDEGPIRDFVVIYAVGKLPA
jgi:SAM-dependent methyltransferase